MNTTTTTTMTPVAQRRAPRARSDDNDRRLEALCARRPRSPLTVMEIAEETGLHHQSVSRTLISGLERLERECRKRDISSTDVILFFRELRGIGGAG